MKKTRLLIGGFFFLLQPGCVQLKELHTLTDTCQKALEEDKQIPYGYADYCEDSCYLFNVSGRQLADFDCNCHPGEINDTIIRKEYDILGAYFAALGKLAGAASYFNFIPIGSSVPAGTYGSLVITANESKVVTTLATVATDLLTTHYKSKKIKEVLVKYHDTLDIAMQLLQLHIDNLKSRIGLMQTKLQQRCDLLMAKVPPPSDAEKWATVYTYKQKYKELGRIIASYDKRYRSLDKIRLDHIELYKNVNELSSEGFKKKVVDMAYDIIYINNH